MNERIKELWDQAAESTAAYPSGQNNSWETQVNFMDKFAELIVRECAGVCNDARDSTDYVTTVGMADHCALAIMNRFGVK